MSKDPYLDLIQAQWENISLLYNRFAVVRPVILLDVQAHEIHAYPFDEFKAILDAGSQAGFEQQYQRAVANRDMVLFVRDTQRKQFLSYTLKLEDDA